jgi:hypothetical protein
VKCGREHAPLGEVVLAVQQQNRPPPGHWLEQGVRVASVRLAPVERQELSDRLGVRQIDDAPGGEDAQSEDVAIAVLAEANELEGPTEEQCGLD